LAGAGRLPAITIEADLPEDVLALLDPHLLDLGGTYGDPKVGDPSSTTNYVTGGSPVLGWAVVSVPSPTGTYVCNGSAFPGTGVGGAGEKRIA